MPRAEAKIFIAEHHAEGGKLIRQPHCAAVFGSVVDQVNFYADTMRIFKKRPDRLTRFFIIIVIYDADRYVIFQMRYPPANFLKLCTIISANGRVFHPEFMLTYQLRILFLQCII